MSSVKSAESAAVNSQPPAKPAAAPNALDKDAFLRLLVTQLRYQDPTKPMEDREFISQLAQFSSLEQMTNVSSGLASLNQGQGFAQAISLVGHTVELKTPDGEAPLSGVVEKVNITDGVPSLVIAGKEHPLSEVLAVK